MGCAILWHVTNNNIWYDSREFVAFEIVISTWLTTVLILIYFYMMDSCVSASTKLRIKIEKQLIVFNSEIWWIPLLLLPVFQRGHGMMWHVMRIVCGRCFIPIKIMQYLQKLFGMSTTCDLSWYICAYIASFKLYLISQPDYLVFNVLIVLQINDAIFKNVHVFGGLTHQKPWCRNILGENWTILCQIFTKLKCWIIFRFFFRYKYFRKQTVYIQSPSLSWLVLQVKICSQQESEH